MQEIRGKGQVRGVGAINAIPGVRGGNFNQGHYLNCVITARWRYLKAPNSIKLNKQGEKRLLYTVRFKSVVNGIEE